MGEILVLIAGAENGVVKILEGFPGLGKSKSPPCPCKLRRDKDGAPELRMTL